MESGNKSKRFVIRGYKRIPIGVAIVFLVLVLVAHFPPVIVLAWQKSRGTRFEPYATRWALANFDRSKDPVLVALARYSIGEGHLVDDVIAKHGPFHSSKFGPYVALEPSYMADAVMAFESYIIVAKDGRLRFAHWWTCTGQLEFFNSMSKDEEAEFVSMREAHRKQVIVGRIAAQMALAGGVLYDGLYSIPLPNPAREARMAVAGIGAFSEPTTPVDDVK